MLLLWERDFSNYKGKLQHREQNDPKPVLMIVVGREGMHTGVAHMHTRPQPNKHTLTHPEQVQGMVCRKDIKKGGLSKKLQAVKEEAARI